MTLLDLTPRVATTDRLATLPVTPERDDTNFHLYFKCEQCRYLPHCSKAVAADRPPAEWDVSAVVGLSRQGKAALARLGVWLGPRGAQLPLGAHADGVAGEPGWHDQCRAWGDRFLGDAAGHVGEWRAAAVAGG